MYEKGFITKDNRWAAIKLIAAPNPSQLPPNDLMII